MGKLQGFITVLIICMLSLLMFSCAMGPKLSVEELRRADFGPYPDNYQEIIKNHFHFKLFDPYSAQYTFGKPIKRYVRGGEIFGWAVCGTINAKNRMGGYVGAQQFWVIISHGKIERYFFDKYLAPAACRRLNKERFE